MNNLIIIPRATEKAYGLVNKTNTYVFNVPASANKQQIVASVESQFGVKVSSIKTLIQNGKALRVRISKSKETQPVTVRRKDSKKAYVTLAKGYSIKVFDEPEATEKEKK